MKTIFACGAFGEPYKIELTDHVLSQIEESQRTLKTLPWNGRMLINVIGVELNTKKKAVFEIDISKWGVGLVLDDDPIVDGLLNLPDIYVSPEFDMYLPDNVFSLSEHDIELIEAWKNTHVKNEENI